MKEQKQCADCGNVIDYRSVRCRTCAAKLGTAKVRKDVPDREKIPELYAKGLSTVAIAKQLGLSKGAVHSILRVRGVKLRSGKESLELLYPEGRFGGVASNWKGGKRFDCGTHRKYYKGKLSINWNGGRWHLQQGYVYIYSPDHPNATKQGYVMEHRLVMEKHLGRILDKKEIVHHLNGVKDDNRIENLGLMKCLGQHVAIHFDAIAESDRLRKENEELKSELQKYKDRFGELK